MAVEICYSRQYSIVRSILLAKVYYLLLVQGYGRQAGTLVVLHSLSISSASSLAYTSNADYLLRPLRVSASFHWRRKPSARMICNADIDAVDVDLQKDTLSLCNWMMLTLKKDFERLSLSSSQDLPIPDSSSDIRGQVNHAIQAFLITELPISIPHQCLVEMSCCTICVYQVCC